MLKKIIFVAFQVSAFCAGIIFEKHLKERSIKYLGTIRIDHSEAEEPEKLFLELESDIDNLVNGKVVMFKVSRENYISHK